MVHRHYALGGALALSLTVSAPALAQPRITAFTPDSGPPGTLVKIIGERLDMVDEAYFGGVEATDIRHVSDLHIKVVVPAGAKTGPIGLVDRDGLRTFTARAFEVPAAPIARPLLSLAPPVPTPAVGSVTLSFSLPARGLVRLTIFDLRGRPVRTLANGSVEAGPNERIWDGRDANGLSAPAGLYFARLDADDRTLLRRIVLIR